MRQEGSCREQLSAAVLQVIILGGKGILKTSLEYQEEGHSDKVESNNRWEPLNGRIRTPSKDEEPE